MQCREQSPCYICEACKCPYLRHWFFGFRKPLVQAFLTQFQDRIETSISGRSWTSFRFRVTKQLYKEVTPRTIRESIQSGHWWSHSPGPKCFQWIHFFCEAMLLNILINILQHLSIEGFHCYSATRNITSVHDWPSTFSEKVISYTSVARSHTHKMLTSISLALEPPVPKIQVDIHWSYIDHIGLLSSSKVWQFVASSPSYVNPVECHLQGRVQELVPPAWRGIVINLTISDQWMREIPSIFCSVCSGLVIADLDELWGPCSD